MTQTNTLKELEVKEVKLAYYTYDIIRPKTKQALAICKYILYSKLKTLRGCYNTWSYAKENAFNQCICDYGCLIELLEKDNKHIIERSCGILSYNIFRFTFGAYLNVCDEDGAQYLYIMYVTPTKSIIYIY